MEAPLCLQSCGSLSIAGSEVSGAGGRGVPALGESVVAVAAEARVERHLASAGVSLGRGIFQQEGSQGC